ncbi:oligoribonuclease [Pelagicoccus sp. SDUM812003]|uniref:oligoribonuclease n=1 Tax=Pelagicoccus sp. SDUM812003 TaxID=3041267 RepID=UPI00280EDA58|nr:oligoribonuclease [Pelagicoccus sp. SDUM812003]MDQ8201969.1 oligoribonuclease [Pelagicoccus sp. SDUM812003]
MSKRKYCWIDLEMTGLDPETDRIVEAAVIVTNKQLEPVFEWETAVKQSPETLDAMNEWCKHHHTESGLIERIPYGISEEALDDKLAEITLKYFKKKNPVVICGNSIAQDRKFIDRYLPKFAQRLHYRMLDVSSFKIVFREMLGREFKKQNTHRALDDIRESIAELKYYMSAIDPSCLALIDNTPKAERSEEEAAAN